MSQRSNFDPSTHVFTTRPPITLDWIADGAIYPLAVCAQLFNVCEQTVRNWVRKGLLTGIHAQKWSLWYITGREIREFAAAMRTRNPGEWDELQRRVKKRAKFQKQKKRQETIVGAENLSLAAYLKQFDNKKRKERYNAMIMKIAYNFAGKSRVTSGDVAIAFKELYGVTISEKTAYRCRQHVLRICALRGLLRG